MAKALFKLTVLIAVLVTACSDDKPKQIDIPPGPPEVANRTVLLYQLVDDNRIPRHLRSDFYEAVEGMAAVDDRNNNLLVFSYLTNDLPYLIYLQKDSSGEVIADTIKTFPEDNPLKIEYMTEVIQFVMDEYPAKDYGLVLESHGEGWINANPSANRSNSRWFGYHHNSKMDITDLRYVLEKFDPFNFILFDACYMQAIEVAYELRNCADYIISSPAEIPGPGAPYQKIVPLMFQDSDDVAINIAQGYYDYYKDYKGSFTLPGSSESDWPYGVSVSAIKTSELEALAEITNEILSLYMSNKRQIASSSLFYYDYDYRRYYYDFNGFIEYITEDASLYNNWKAAFDAAQPYFETTATNYSEVKRVFSMDGAAGISIYIPGAYSDRSLINYYKSLDWYKDGGWQSAGW